MALTLQEADDLRKMLLEIERLSKALRQNVNTTNLQDLEKSADNIKFIFEKLNKEFKEQNDEISYAAVGFKRIVQEISSANVGLRESNKIYNNLSSLASQIQSHQQGISELSSKELANKKKKAEGKQLKLLQELYPNKKMDELELMAELYTNKEIKQLALDQCWDEKKIDKYF
jgi:3-methyladenine DNA glycosylase/8-oxoguanine DNA glycosylase